MPTLTQWDTVVVALKDTSDCILGLCPGADTWDPASEQDALSSGGCPPHLAKALIYST